jgi:mannose-1-phosphate guanylyltransferase
MFGSSNSFVFSKERKTMLIDGLKDYIVIDTPDKLMILKGENEQRLKEYLAAIENTSTK